MQLELYQTPAAPVLKKLYWLPVEYRLVFKTATHVYKFIHTGFHMYFAPYLSLYSSSFSARCSQSVCNFLVVPKFYPSTQKSVKQFGYSFAFDSPTVWNALPLGFVPPLAIATFRKKLKSSLSVVPDHS